MRPKLLTILLISVFLLFATTTLSQQQQRQPGQPIQSQFDPTLYHVYMPFMGQWLPDVASELIGFQNFKTLQNIRYVDGGIEGTQGYSKINTTLIDGTYYKARSGYHFKKDRPTESHVLYQAYNYNGTKSKVYDNETSIPNQGNFNSVALHDDASYGTFTGQYGHNTLMVQALFSSGATHGIFVGASQLTSGATHGIVAEEIDVAETITAETIRSRFCEGPMGHVIYSNGVESQVWGGDASLVAAFISSSAAVTEYATNPKDYTIEVNNEFDTTTESAGVSGYGTGGTAYAIISATRPISGVSFLISKANSQTGQTVYFDEWNGSVWSYLETADGTNGLTQDGKVTLGSTVDTSKPKYLERRMLYHYLFQCKGGASIYNVTLDIPWQDIVDIWDGQGRIPVGFHTNRNDEWQDNTLWINTDSSEDYAIGAQVGGLDTNDYVIAIFEDRMQAIHFDMHTGNTNTITATGISTWCGDNWVSAGVTYDGTSDLSATKPLSKSGALTWAPPDEEIEFIQTLFDIPGYAYKISWDGDLGSASGDESLVIIDRIYGVPAPLKLQNFKFPVYFKRRVLLCGYLKGNEPNRIDFSAPNRVDVWNGENTSDNGRRPLYVGGGEEINAAISIFNRFGQNLYENLLIFKDNQLYIWTGDINEEAHQVSDNIGCAAWATLCKAEVAYEMIPGELQRNIAIWLSAAGPMIFDGTLPKPIRGIDRYFDINDDLYVGQASIEDAFAWFDPNHKEWNLRVGEYWFCYDFVRRRWFERDVGDGELPMCAFQVADVYGKKYIYAGIDTGYMMRLEHGTDWDGSGVTQVCETGDFYLDGDGWNQTVLRSVKLNSKVISEDVDLQIEHFANTSTSGTSLHTVALDSGTGSSERDTVGVGKPSWLHRLKYSTQTSGTTKGWRPLGHGYEFKVIREDE